MDLLSTTAYFVAVVKLDDFDYDLPTDQIALKPVDPRDHSRLMVVDRKTETIRHHYFYELPEILQSNDLLVVNNSKVLPARFFVQSSGQGKVEVLLLRPLKENALVWKCLFRPGRRIKTTPTPLSLPDGSTCHAYRDGDNFFIQFSHVADERALHAWLEAFGSPPLPPYLHREADERDKKNYQTVYAKTLGSVAAPTAGLHFTPDLLEKLSSVGIQRKELTLHVGYGTFSPVKEENIENHMMHEELYTIPADLRESLQATRSAGKRVIAVGTTALRALESMERFGNSGETNIFIRPGYQFKNIDGLITNFHLPKSSLIILVAALLGIAKTKNCYELAIREGYRFYSYGDAMLIL